MLRRSVMISACPASRPSSGCYGGGLRAPGKWRQPNGWNQRLPPAAIDKRKSRAQIGAGALEGQCYGSSKNRTAAVGGAQPQRVQRFEKLGIASAFPHNFHF